MHSKIRIDPGFRIKTSVLLSLLLFISVNSFSQNPDIRILRSINSPRSLPSDRFFRFISNSDAYLVAGIPVVIGAVGYAKRDSQMFRNACVTLTAVALNSGVTLALKYSVNRARPFKTYPDITKKSAAGSPSFPSGHTSSAFTLATSLSLN